MNNVSDNAHFKLIQQKMPHIADRLSLFWGSEYFQDIACGLFNDTRDGQRQGFPEEIAKALFELMQEHEKLYPTKPKQQTDIWDYL